MGSRKAGMGSSTSSRQAVCFGVLVILLCLASCSPSNNDEEITFCSLDDLECLLHGNSGGWLSDPQPEELYTSQCDIEVVDLSFQSLTTKDFVERHLRGDKPVIIIGLQDDWLARQKWARPSFRETYGSHSAQIAAGSVIVGAGGSQLPMLRITDLLDRMEAHMWSGNVTAAPLADFTFDTSVLDHLPGVRGDYRTPEVFGQTFDREERRKMGDHHGDRGRGASWHMLSLAGSRAGLPAHAHGETWLALVHGLKRWFAWPPGGGAAAATQAAAGYHPLEGSWAWFRKVYPRVTEGAAEHPWEVPLECVQRPGEVLFLPAGWNHITLNIGEAIGVGGQASYGPPSRREADAARALATNPGDAVHLVSQGLHSAHRWEMDMGNTDIIEEGLAYLDRAIAANPTDPGAWHTKTKFLLQVALHPEAPLPREAREAYRGRALAALRAGLAAFDRRRVPAAVPDAVLAGMQRKLVELLYPAEEDPAAIEAAVRAVLELSGGGGDGALHVDLALAIQKQQDPQRWGEVADLFDYAVQLGLGSLEPFRVKYLKRKAAQARKNAENEEKRLGAARVAVEHQERREKREQHRQERRPARGAGETPPPRSDPSVVRVQEGVSFSLSREGEIVRSSGSAPPPVGSAGSSRRRTEGQMPLPQSEPTDSPPQSRRRKKQQGNDGGEL